MPEDTEPDVETYDSEDEFREAAYAAFERYIERLAEGEEPKPGMQFFGVVKVDGAFQVCVMTFGKPN